MRLFFIPSPAQHTWTKTKEIKMPPSRNHTFPIRNSHLSPLLTPALQLDWGIAIRLHIREQNSTPLITDAFQSRHHYIFKPLSFKNVTKKTFLPAPVGTLSSSTLMILLVSSLPLPTAKNTLLCNSRLWPLCSWDSSRQPLCLKPGFLRKGALVKNSY